MSALRRSCWLPLFALLFYPCASSAGDLAGGTPTAVRMEPGSSPLIATAREKAVLRALASDTEIDFVETPLSDAVDFLQDRHGLPIKVDRKALENAGLDPSMAITFRISDVSLRSALRLALKDYGLAYIVDDEVLLITTPEVANSRMMTRIYRVSDLLQGFGDSFDIQSLAQVIATVAASEFKLPAGPQMGMGTVGMEGGGAMSSMMMSGAGGESGMSSMPGMRGPSTKMAGRRPKNPLGSGGYPGMAENGGYGAPGGSGYPGGMYGEGMMPGAGSMGGGLNTEAAPTGAIHFVPGALIVTQTWPAHERIAELLDSLRQLDSSGGTPAAGEAAPPGASAP